MQKSYDPILDSIADGVFTVDKEWNITAFNKAAQHITGISRKDALGRKCWEIFHTDVCEKSCLLKKTIATNRQCINKTVHIVTTRGETVPISISTAILRDESGNIIGGVETFRDLSEIEELRKEIKGKFHQHDIITRDHRLLDFFTNLPPIAKSDSPVLILGESGTGKELLAKAIHIQSNHSKGPFIAVNCGALPENLLESELFGYKKGAFTDAKTDKPGRFERAKNGTLFLDEIGDLSKSVQVKLLRVLQERVFEPLGSTEAVQSSARIIAATNRNLEQMVSSGEFRQDLYYRINIIPVLLPPLRDRTGDIPLLIDHFIQHFNSTQGKKIERLSSEALGILLEHQYPGNIRELENILHHSFVLCQGTIIERKHLPAYIFQATKNNQSDSNQLSFSVFDKKRIEDSLARNKFSRSATARELGIHVATLWRKMRKYGIS